MPLTRTVQQVIEIISEHVDIGNVRGVQLLNEAHLEILANCHLVPDTTVDITLTANTLEYALPDDCVKIWDATYFTSATSHQVLKATNVDTLFYSHGANWELAQSSVPIHFYERGGMIGLWPPPATATSGSGYPKVTLYYTQFTELTLTSSMPTTIPSVYPWVYHVLSRQAAVAHPDKIQLFKQLYAQEMERMQTWVFGRTGRDKPKAFARVPKVRRA